LVITTLDRKKLWLVQTPQVFEYKLILNAYEKAREDEFKGTDVDIYISHQWGEGTISINGNSWENEKDRVSIRWEGWVINRGPGGHAFGSLSPCARFLQTRFASGEADESIL